MNILRGIGNLVRAQQDRRGEKVAALPSTAGGQAAHKTSRCQKGSTRAKRSKISVIIPAFNEEGRISETISSTKRATTDETPIEVIVVDGGSTDKTVSVARSMGAKVIRSAKGRGTQQDMGSRAASGEYLFFLHADSELPARYDSILFNSVDALQGKDGKDVWGAFGQLAIKGRKANNLLRMVEVGAMLRTKCLHMPYGDQCLFFHRDAYKECGGYKHIPLMEVSEGLKRSACGRGRVCLEEIGLLNRGELCLDLPT